MGEWREKTLGKLTSYIAKGIPPKYVEEVGPETISVLNQKCNRNYRISYSEARLHDNGAKKVPADKMLRDFDVLINSTGTGTAGRVAQIWHVPEPTTLDGHMILMRPTKEIDPLYYGYAIKAFQAQVESFAEGSTGQTEVNKRRLQNEIVIRFPVSMEEQRAVGRMLKAIDEKIQNNTEINNNLQEQMEALHRSWFVDYTPFGGAKPSNWVKADIYSIANIIYGAPFASKLFNTKGIGKPIIRIRDLKKQDFVTYTTEIHPKGHLIQPGDIVVGMDGEFRPYIWGNSEAWLNQRVCIFESKLPSDKAFMFYTIKPLLNIIEQTQVATTVIHIGKKDYDTFEIILPDRETLDQFGEITTPMLERIVKNSIENKKLAKLRDALLPQLMSGEIDVSDISL